MVVAGILLGLAVLTYKKIYKRPRDKKDPKDHAQPTKKAQEETTDVKPTAIVSAKHQSIQQQEVAKEAIINH